MFIQAFIAASRVVPKANEITQPMVFFKVSMCILIILESIAQAHTTLPSDWKIQESDTKGLNGSFKTTDVYQTHSNS